MHSIVFHLTLLNIEKNLWLVFMYYILKNYDLYITYYILLFFVIYKDGLFETSKIND